MSPAASRASLFRRLSGLLASASALLFAALPLRAEVFDPTTYTLDNGLQLVVIENHRAPIVTHMVWYKVGAADEPWGQSGIAHFLEHLMFKGTEAHPEGAFSRIVAQNGGSQNAFTSQDYTAYFQNIAADRLELVMELEADRMTNLVLTDEVVATEREVVLEERRSRVDNEPSAILHEQADATLFQNHPYGIPIIGWEHEIRELSTEDALRFYERYYAPNNAIVVVAGDVVPDEVRALAEQHYGGIEPRTMDPRARPKEPEQRAPREVVLRDPKVGQPSWRRSYLAPSYHAGETEHAYALQVLGEILGGGSTSRLYRSLVVEQKLAAGAGGHYSALVKDHSTFTVYATPNPGVEIEPLRDAVDAEIGRIVEGGVTEEELTRAVDRLRAAAVFARDRLSTGARVLGMAMTTGSTVADVEAWPDRIAEVTAEQVQAAARAVFRPEQSVTAVLLPEKKVDRRQKSQAEEPSQ